MEEVLEILEEVEKLNIVIFKQYNYKLVQLLWKTDKLSIDLL